MTFLWSSCNAGLETMRFQNLCLAALEPFWARPIHSANRFRIGAGLIFQVALQWRRSKTRNIICQAFRMQVDVSDVGVDYPRKPQRRRIDPHEYALGWGCCALPGPKWCSFRWGTSHRLGTISGCQLIDQPVNHHEGPPPLHDHAEGSLCLFNLRKLQHLRKRLKPPQEENVCLLL